MRARLLASDLVALAVVLLSAGCGAAERADEAGEAGAASSGDSKLRVYVVNYPLQYFAQRIGGDLVEVEFRAPADIDPAFWSPAAEAISDFQSADLILLNGAGYARWVDRVTLPTSKLVNTSDGFSGDYIYVESAVSHTHGPAGEHSHGELAFTTWLDPTLALEQARAVKDAFAAARPQGASMFSAGFESLERDLSDLDQALVDLTARSEPPLVASHPVYQYLARRYELDLVSVHFEPDEYPDEGAWERLERILEEHRARWMIWEAEPMERTRARLGELGVMSVVFDPAGNVPAKGGEGGEGGDFLGVMRANVGNLEEAFGGGGG